ncbi:50S ribosomal protein L3 [Buchnera aphidicola (Taiwanaphis decaspermi)]|uniref:50S ribosomal protein L3 n=1 Tax=Buchnera aphidicola TaxID=9 RepID=UPI0031B83FC7
MIGLVGKKIGMTRIFNKKGISIPVTVIQIFKNRVVQVKNTPQNVCNTIQITTSSIKKNKKINKSIIGHYKKHGVTPGIGLWEFKNLDNTKFYEGQNIGVDIFNDINKVDITGISKGKGFAGTVKRWNFSMQDASHGNSLSHRAPGSIGQNQTPGRVFKGKKMSGHLGNHKVTIQNLKIVKINIKKELIIIKGSIPGFCGNNVIIRQSVKNI